MAVIEVKKIKKEFVVTVGKKGFKGAVKTLFAPEKKTIKALDDVSFEINEGEILGFVGPNGAGKSTLVKILSGILHPTDGEALVNGIHPYKKPQLNAMGIGVVFGQRSRLMWSLPANDSFEYLKALYSIPDEVYEENISYFKESLGIEELLFKPIRTLSLGQKMRVEIAASLLHSPQIIFLDEPTIGLDVVGKYDLHKMINKINKEKKITVLLVTHDVIDIEQLCSKVIVIDKGKLIWDGTISDLKNVKGNTRKINITFSEEIPALASDKLTLVDLKGLRHKYIYSDMTSTMGDMLDEIQSAGNITDLTIEETPIEEIIRGIYKQ